ncbi:MAG TPA: molybdenum cofactor biosynthesis protein MoaE [Burkholderiaceae bacterium]|jgi:molybdopterin synthase catalytic subunit|nr:molybdenum cofactor biosynthesis protein MoaE [Burkholderiaceae bacterium]
MPVRIQHEDFDAGAEIAVLRARNPKIGAVASFIGIVRDVNDGAAVASIALEHYPGMTEKSLTAISEQAKERWNLIDVLIIHRVGTLAPTDQIVLVVTTSSHRGDAFAACQFVMDYLKTDAPFWKKETTGDGVLWVDARDSDTQARDRWK